MSKEREQPRYKCCACGAEWVGDFGPQRFGLGQQAPACPKCPSLYVKWINYEKGKADD